MTTNEVNGILLSELTPGDTVELISVSPNHVFSKTASKGSVVVTAVGRRWISASDSAGQPLGRFDKSNMRHEDRSNRLALYGTVEDYRRTCERHRISRYLQVRMLRSSQPAFEDAVANNLSDEERNTLNALTGKILGE